MVFWLYGLSGSGKSTLALKMEAELHAKGILSVVLDGDEVRTGLSKDLGFSDSDRSENVRRVSEVAKILSSNGIVVVVSLITPLEKLRAAAREIIGADRFREVFVKSSYATCRKRDVKGLYAKAEEGRIASFTGQGSDFEEPKTPPFLIDTEKETEEISFRRLFDFMRDSIAL